MTTPRPSMDRHLFASNASRYNTAWETYGWTEGLDRVRAGRLEERVPWAAELAEWDAPPVLVHGGAPGAAADDPADGTLGLPEAFLPLDGRLGFSVAGVVRAPADRAQAKRTRTATHTLLFDPAFFWEIDGFPQGVHLDLSPDQASGEAPWFADFRDSTPTVPSELPAPGPIPGRDRFQQARRREVERLVRLALDDAGASAARRALEGVYRAVGGALRNPPGLGAPIQVGWPERGTQRDGCVLLRLAWLSLPLKDRAKVFYSMLDLRGRHPSPCLVPGVAGSVPGHGPDGREVPSEPDPASAWAELVLERPKEQARVAARLDVGRMSLFEGKSTPYVLHWALAQAGHVDLLERAQTEALGAKPRWRGLGRLAAREVVASPLERKPPWVGDATRHQLLRDNHRFYNGFVRGFRGEVNGADVARLVVSAGIGAKSASSGIRSRGIELAKRGLEALAAAGAEGHELGRVVERLRARDGEGAAEDALVLVVRCLSSSPDRWIDIPAMVDAAGLGDPIAPSLADNLVQVFLARPAPPDRAWRRLLRRIWVGMASAESVASDRSDSRLAALQRMAWVERRTWGDTSLAALAKAGRPGSETLARSLMGGEPVPPLSVFLALRDALADSPAGHRRRAQRR